MGFRTEGLRFTINTWVKDHLRLSLTLMGVLALTVSTPPPLLSLALPAPSRAAAASDWMCCVKLAAADQ
jgi:hypothetical protein